MTTKVKKREVFYISGYDPRGSRHYYNLYKKESQKQSKINKIKVDVSAKKRTDKHMHSWNIETFFETYTTKTEYNFLAYDDLIRKNWKYSFFSVCKDSWFYIKTYLFTGVLFRLIKASPPQIIVLLYPIVYCLLFVCLAIFAIFASFSMFAHQGLALLFSLILLYILSSLFLRFGEKFNVFWLLRIYIFSAKYILEENEALELRIENFAQNIVHSIKNAKAKEVDEILIVSHSVGTILMIPVLAKVLEDNNFSQEDTKMISLLTLGQCIPLVSFLKEATQFKTQMASLVEKPYFKWLDYSSIVDGACFPLMDYYKHANIDSKYTPIFLSPRFHTLYSQDVYKRVKKDRFVVHFLYLMSTQLKGEYDYFKMTAGDERLDATNKKRKR